MKKILPLICLLLIMVSTSVEAVSYFKYGEVPIELKRECFYEGDLCDSDYNCSITVYDQNLDVMVDNVVMNRTAAYYEHNVTGMLEVGEYRTRMTCDDGAYAGSEVWYFEITNTGDGTGNRMFLILGILSFVLLFTSVFMRSYNLGFAAGVMFLVTGMYTMIYGIDLVSDMYTRAIAFVFLGLGILFVIYGGYNSVWNNKEEE